MGTDPTPRPLARSGTEVDAAVEWELLRLIPAEMPRSLAAFELVEVLADRLRPAPVSAPAA